MKVVFEYFKNIFVIKCISQITDMPLELYTREIQPENHGKTWNNSVTPNFRHAVLLEVGDAKPFLCMHNSYVPSYAVVV